MRVSSDQRALAPLSSEFKGASFGDIRLTERLGIIVEAAAARPAESFSKQAQCDAALEATYRFLGNPRVKHEQVLAPHIACTVQRAADAGVVLAVHDTTSFEFDPESLIRDELGWLTRTKRGFLGHFALGVSADGLRRPLGLLGLSLLFRPPFQTGSTKKKKVHSTNELEGEARRWGELADEVSERLATHAEVIHVMDREADAYPLLVAFDRYSRRFVVRVLHDRSIDEEVEGGAARLSEALETAQGVLKRDVRVSKRKLRSEPAARKKHPARDERLAKLHFSAMAVTLKAPKRTQLPKLTLNVVRVWEPHPPQDQDPIEWKLFTSEPVDTPEQVAAVVDWYRSRWVIEEFFKALKTGCAYEKRQLESKHAMLNALAVLAPVAWRLLLLRSLGRNHPDLPATEVFSDSQIQLLTALNKQRNLKVKLSRKPTIQQALLVVAEMGGYVKHSGGPPGWMVLGSGLQELLIAELGWAARATPKHM